MLRLFLGLLCLQVTSILGPAVPPSYIYSWACHVISLYLFLGVLCHQLMLILRPAMLLCLLLFLYLTCCQLTSIPVPDTVGAWSHPIIDTFYYEKDHWGAIQGPQ